MLPQWLHPFATFATLIVAAAWLMVQLVRTAKSRSPAVGCARCDRNPARPEPRGRRSEQLRVIG